MVEEKRANPRAAVQAPFKVTHDSFGTITVESRDFSVGGIYAINDKGINLPPEGTIMDVKILGMGAIATNSIQAEVVRVEDGGFGLKFLEMDV